MIALKDLVQLIEQGLPGAEIFVQDLTGNQDHYQATVVSVMFEGKSRVQRQQMVMAPLAEPLKGPLHALTLKTYTPSEWEKV